MQKMSCDKYSNKTKATRLIPVFTAFLAIVSLLATFTDVENAPILPP